jgi:hypothetical protein
VNVKIVVFIPVENKEQVKLAMFAAGAGKIGLYDHCAFESEGIGQFRPLPGSNPHLGKQLQLEFVAEIRVEMICPKDKIKAVVAAMKKAHPYEVVAYDVVELIDV